MAKKPCGECGKRAEVEPCPYCGMPICEGCQEDHMSTHGDIEDLKPKMARKDGLFEGTRRQLGLE